MDRKRSSTDFADLELEAPPPPPPLGREEARDQTLLDLLFPRMRNTRGVSSFND